MDLSSVFAVSLQSQSEDPRMRIGRKSASTKLGVDDDILTTAIVDMYVSKI